METVSSEGLLVLHSSDEFTGGFLTTWGELESGEEKNMKEKFCYHTELGNVMTVLLAGQRVSENVITKNRKKDQFHINENHNNVIEQLY